MTEWNVVGVLIALVGLFLTVGAPILKLVKSITELDFSVKALKNDLKALKDDLEELSVHNSKSHERIFSRLDGQEETLRDHETRIQVIEGRDAEM